MANITHKGNPITTVGALPPVGTKAPDFVLTKQDETDVGLKDFAGKKKILNIVPSLDTGTCALSAKTFNEKIKSRKDTVVLTVSCDLPYAQKRFCKENMIDQVVTLSQMRNRDFGQNYGVTVATGKLTGIFSRAIVVLDEADKVLYTEQVPEIAQEPNYDAALAALGK